MRQKLVCECPYRTAHLHLPGPSHHHRPLRIWEGWRARAGYIHSVGFYLRRGSLPGVRTLWKAQRVDGWLMCTVQGTRFSTWLSGWSRPLPYFEALPDSVPGSDASGRSFLAVRAPGLESPVRVLVSDDSWWRMWYRAVIIQADSNQRPRWRDQCVCVSPPTINSWTKPFAHWGHTTTEIHYHST